MARATQLKAPTQDAKPEQAGSPETENPLSSDPPKLSGVHEKTKDIVQRAMKRDAKAFDEMARAQTSGQ